jgi:hypothetical protein
MPSLLRREFYCCRTAAMKSQRLTRLFLGLHFYLQISRK